MLCGYSQTLCLQLNVLCALSPREDVDVSRNIAMFLIYFFACNGRNRRITKAADAIYLYFIPIVAKYAPTSEIVLLATAINVTGSYIVRIPRSSVFTEVAYPYRII